MCRVITWDLEIAIDPEELGNDWEAVRRGAAGVSCICLYDTKTERVHTYGHQNLEECMAHLNDADLLVGFNTLSFDTPIMESLTDYTLLPHQYDILAEIWRVLPSKRKGFKLKELGPRMNLGHKTRPGASAPALFKEGRFGELFDYCINDVMLTRRLANWINANGYILTPEGDPLEITRPEVVC